MSLYASLAPLASASTRARVRRFRIGWVVVACLDAAAIALVLPLAQAMASIDSAPSGIVQVLIDRLGFTDTGMFTLFLAGAVLVAFVTKSLLAIVFVRSNLRTVEEMEVDTSDQLVMGYLDAPWTFHLHRTTASIQRTLNEGMRRVFVEGLATELPSIGDRAVLALIGLILLVAAPLPTIAVGVYLALATRYYSRLARSAAQASSSALMAQHERGLRYVQQSLASVREIAVTDTAHHFAEQLHHVRAGIASRQRAISQWEQMPRYLLELGMLFAVAIVAVVAFTIYDTPKAVGVVGLFAVAGFRGLPSLNRVLVARAKEQVARPHLAQILDDMRTSHAGDRTVADIDPMTADERIQVLGLDRVEFHYPGRSVLAIADTSLEVRHGEFVGIVGASGAGKSTLVGLILGLLDPSGGRLTVNARSLDACRRSYRARVAYVPQEVVVLDTSIRENVAFGVASDEVNDEHVWASLRRADLEELVRSLPDGLAAPAGETGRFLSGGQRQRLGLARAFYRQAEVLVLDEATSSLDTETEQRILDTLRAVEGLTVISVAHRPSAVRHADRIYVLESGRVADFGTFDDLASRSEHFRRLMLSGDAPHR